MKLGYNLIIIYIYVYIYCTVYVRWHGQSDLNLALGTDKGVGVLCVIGPLAQYLNYRFLAD